jgi:nucleotide-binding universal stress UspA family protein
MYNRILVPLDESKIAEQVLPYVRTLASCFDETKVELLRVLDSEEANQLDFDLMAKARNDSSEYLEHIKHTFAAPERVTGIVETGKPAEVIVDCAGDAVETLIAMSTHSRSGVQRLFMGSVATKVLSGTRSPLLLARATEAAPVPSAKISEIVLPLDGSAVSELAMPDAIVLAQTFGAAVHLVRAYSLAKYAAAGGGSAMALEYPKLMEREENEVRAYLEEKSDLFESKGLSAPSRIVKEGEAAAVIADVARGFQGSALVVMSSHGKSGLGRWLLGGTADKVVRSSESPVLIIRPPLND